jgi:predicted TIM-barrel fold metal-dependent hydrolase
MISQMTGEVVDFHTHIYPEKIAAKAVASIGEFYQIAMQQDGTVEGLLASGKSCGIGRFVVFSAAAVPGQVMAINDYIAGACRDHPEVTGFGTLHKDMEKPHDEIERLIGLGLRGLKFHPDMQRFNIDDERMMDIYAAIEGRLPVIFHTGDYRYAFSHPARLARVLDNFPRLCAVATHFGGWSMPDIAYDYFFTRRCYFDVSSSLPFIGLRRAAELIHSYGAERFLFGSDFPMWDPAACLKEFMRLDITDNEKEQILWKNARGIL